MIEGAAAFATKIKIPLLMNGALVVTSDFRNAQCPEFPIGVQVDHSGEGKALPFDHIVQELQQLINECSRVSESDASAAIAIHKAFPLSRRQAAEPRFWHYCAVIPFRKYVAWRWWKEGKGVPIERFLGGWERNAIGRLWWIAELTYRPGPDPYGRTAAVSSSQEFLLWMVDSFASANPFLLDELIKIVFQSGLRMNGDQIRELFTKITAVRATQLLDAQNPEVIVRTVDSIAKQILV